MNRHLKRAAELVLPRRIFSIVSSIRSRNYQKKLLKEGGIYDATRKLSIPAENSPLYRSKIPHSKPIKQPPWPRTQWSPAPSFGVFWAQRSPRPRTGKPLAPVHKLISTHDCTVLGDHFVE
jgi:hypothetical protein